MDTQTVEKVGYTNKELEILQRIWNNMKEIPELRVEGSYGLNGESVETCMKLVDKGLMTKLGNLSRRFPRNVYFSLTEQGMKEFVRLRKDGTLK